MQDDHNSENATSSAKNGARVCLFHEIAVGKLVGIVLVCDDSAPAPRSYLRSYGQAVGAYVASCGRLPNTR